MANKSNLHYPKNFKSRSNKDFPILKEEAEQLLTPVIKKEVVVKKKNKVNEE